MAARKAGQQAGPQSVMRWSDVDETLYRALDGYGWLPGLRRRCRGEVVRTRVMGRRTTTQHCGRSRTPSTRTMPPQDLEISLRRIPARPASGVLLETGRLDIAAIAR